MVTLATVLGSLLADILYAVADPGSASGADELTHVSPMRRPDEAERTGLHRRPVDADPFGLDAVAADEMTGIPAGARPGAPGASGVQILRVFVENKLAVVGVAVIVFFVLFCFVGPLLYHTNQTNAQDGPAVNSTRTLRRATGTLLGTDDTGFDILGRLMFGGQSSLDRGLRLGRRRPPWWGCSTERSSGFFGGWLDALMMRIVDIVALDPGPVPAHRPGDHLPRLRDAADPGHRLRQLARSPPDSSAARP